MIGWRAKWRIRSLTKISAPTASAAAVIRRAGFPCTAAFIPARRSDVRRPYAHPLKDYCVPIATRCRSAAAPRPAMMPARTGLESRDCAWGLAPYTLGAGRGRLPGVVTLPNLGREVGPRNPERRNLTYTA